MIAGWKSRITISWVCSVIIDWLMTYVFIEKKQWSEKCDDALACHTLLERIQLLVWTYRKWTDEALFGLWNIKRMGTWICNSDDDEEIFMSSLLVPNVGDQKVIKTEWALLVLVRCYGNRWKESMNLRICTDRFHTLIQQYALISNMNPLSSLN